MSASAELVPIDPERGPAIFRALVNQLGGAESAACIHPRVHRGRSRSQTWSRSSCRRSSRGPDITQSSCRRARARSIWRGRRATGVAVPQDLLELDLTGELQRHGAATCLLDRPCGM